MTNIGRDHYTTREIPNSEGASEVITALELRTAELEIRLIELEVHCANLTSKLAALESLLAADSANNNYGC